MHTVTGKLTKAAQQFQAGDSVGFGIRIGVKYKDRKTNQDEWTNYKAAIFAKSPNQIAFYEQVLVEGAVVSVGCEKQAIEVYDGQNGQVFSIDMLNANLVYAFNPNSQSPAQQSQQGGYGQQPAQQPAPQQRPQHQAQQPPPMNSFDDDIPF